jgi:hypothetical protein
LATFARLVFRFAPDDDKPLDLFDEDEPPLDLLRAERPLPDNFLDEPPPDDDEVLDRSEDDELFDRPLDDELLPPPLFEPPELFDELDRLLPPDDFDEPLVLRPDDDEDDDFDLPDAPEKPAPDFDRLLPPSLDREDEVFTPVDRPPPLCDADERPRPDDVRFSEAAAIAPTAAPAAAPLIISPAMSMTLSTMADELLDLDDLLRDEVDEDEPPFREPLDLDLLAITFPPNDRNKKPNCL